MLAKQEYLTLPEKNSDDSCVKKQLQGKMRKIILPVDGFYDLCVEISPLSCYNSRNRGYNYRNEAFFL